MDSGVVAASKTGRWPENTVLFGANAAAHRALQEVCTATMAVCTAAMAASAFAPASATVVATASVDVNVMPEVVLPPSFPLPALRANNAESFIPVNDATAPTNPVLCSSDCGVGLIATTAAAAVFVSCNATGASTGLRSINAQQMLTSMQQSFR